MQSSLVLTVLGFDRAGLVKSIAEAVAAHQGNWQESRMVHLAGQFAGLAHVTLPQEQLAALTQTLQALQHDGLQILLQHCETPTTRAITPLSLELLGHDRPGIIHDITRLLAALNVNGAGTLNARHDMLTLFVSMFCLRGLVSRIGIGHSAYRFLLKVPGFKMFCGL